MAQRQAADAQRSLLTKGLIPMLRAMIVDDEAPARSELRFLLERRARSARSLEASSVRSAIEMLMESRVDVVFLDISMPGASGLQLAEALHKLKNPPAIVFVTAYSDHAVEAFDVDAVDYLMKPVEEARLDRAIEKVMQHAKPVTDSKATIERIPVEKGGRKVLIPVVTFASSWPRTITPVSIPSMIVFYRRLRWRSRGQALRALASFAFIAAISSTWRASQMSRPLPSGAIQLGITGVDETAVPVSRRRVVPLKKALSL